MKEKERKGQKEYLKKLWLKTFQIWLKQTNMYVFYTYRKLKNPKQDEVKEIHTYTYHKLLKSKKKPKKQKTLGKKKNSKREVTHHIQVVLSKINRKSHTRNHSGQKVVVWLGSSAERINQVNLPTKNSISGKTISKKKKKKGGN